MTTLLIHPYFLCEDPVELRVMKPYPPLGLMYLSACIQSRRTVGTLFVPNLRVAS